MIKKLILKILAFVGLLIPIIGIYSLVNSHYVDKKIDDQAKLGDDITIIALGDSRIECGLNPKHMPGMSNQSHSGEACFITYAKALLYLENNPSINTVIVSLNYHTLSHLSEDAYKEGAATRFPVIKRYPKIMNETMNNGGWINLIMPYLASYGFPSKVNIQPTSNATLLSSGYRDTYACNIEKQKSSNSLKTSNIQFDSKTIWFYENMIKDISDMGKRVIIITAPIYPDLRNSHTSGTRNRTDSIGHALTRMPNVNYLNWSEMILPDSCYSDFSHLNNHGAKIITEKLNTLLKNPQSF